MGISGAYPNGFAQFDLRAEVLLNWKTLCVHCIPLFIGFQSKLPRYGDQVEVPSKVKIMQYCRFLVAVCSRNYLQPHLLLLRAMASSGYYSHTCVPELHPPCRWSRETGADLYTCKFKYANEYPKVFSGSHIIILKLDSLPWAHMGMFLFL